MMIVGTQGGDDVLFLGTGARLQFTPAQSMIGFVCLEFEAVSQ